MFGTLYRSFAKRDVGRNMKEKSGVQVVFLIRFLFYLIVSHMIEEYGLSE